MDGKDTAILALVLAVAVGLILMFCLRLGESVECGRRTCPGTTSPIYTKENACVCVELAR